MYSQLDGKLCKLIITFSFNFKMHVNLSIASYMYDVIVTVKLIVCINYGNKFYHIASYSCLLKIHRRNVKMVLNLHLSDNSKDILNIICV